MSAIVVNFSFELRNPNYGMFPESRVMDHIPRVGEFVRMGIGMVFTVKSVLHDLSDSGHEVSIILD